MFVPPYEPIVLESFAVGEVYSSFPTLFFFLFLGLEFSAIVLPPKPAVEFPPKPDKSSR